ncbi:MAG: penicillin-binding protein 2 [Marinilabiliales bacterium]|nr:penicillin-binding protein 2 [Marinilabiliales bacterium]
MFSLVSLIIVARLFYIQVIDSSYKISAASNVLRRQINYPARGLVYDRNHKLIVYNQAAYDVLVTPREMKQFDTMQFCRIAGVEKTELVSEIKKARAYSLYKPYPVIKQLSSHRYAVLQEQLFKYPGFYIQARTLRQYPATIASHILGYVGEVDQKKIDEDRYYESGDYIGKTGIEQAYENELRGVKGISYMMVDVHNRVKGSFENGKMDTSAVIGKNLISTLHADLQAYGERLLAGKVGSIVAIEPSTGEIMILASSPTFDPGMFVGRDRTKNYATLLNDPLKPMLNRAITSSYPPGSTFKLANAIIGLEEGLLGPEVRYSCAGPRSAPIKCTHNHESPLALESAIRESCNSYFFQAFRATINKYRNAEEGFEAWRSHLLDLGIGQRIGGDLFAESAGNVPKTTYYDRFFGKSHWNVMTIRSLSIGQGELLLTPLQLANMVSIIANKGYYIAPHMVRSIQELDKSEKPLAFEKHVTSADPYIFYTIANGMEKVVESGTARSAAKVDGIAICGKTGTVQNPHGAAHSAFVAFAPKDDPKIAICVYVENGVWGARYAAPIASLIIEKYLNDSISPKRKPLEATMLSSDLISAMHLTGGD